MRVNNSRRWMRNFTPAVVAACAALTALPAAAAAQHSHGAPVPAVSHEHGHAHEPGAHGKASSNRLPENAGQGAYQALSEIVRILEADPATDWTRVDLERVRRHLIDMYEVTLHAEVTERPVEGGFQASVTGSGRTVGAIRRMAAAHARQIVSESSYRAEVTEIQGGVRIRVIVAPEAASPREVTKLRGLGFIGLLTLGDHHGPHHLAMARGGGVEGHP